ncbi:MAG: 6-bladed beta-propeller [Candidatus Methylomirabilia bacterium]
MPRHHRCACLLLGLAALVGFLPAGLPAADVAPAVAPLPVPQWVGGVDARGKAQLTWIKNRAFAAVRIFRGEEGPLAQFRPVAETQENTWVDASVKPGRTYRYRLVGIGADRREGKPSAELVVRIGQVTLRPPSVQELDGYVVRGDGIGLKWSGRDGEDVIAWNIYRKSLPGTEFQLVGSSRTTSYLDTGVEPEGLYAYALTALDSSFRETAFSKELQVRVSRAPATPGPTRPATAWRARRTRLVAVVGGGKDLALQRPADVAVGPLSGDAYVTDSSRNLIFVFSPLGAFKGTLGGEVGGVRDFKNILGLAIDRDENLFVVDAGTGRIQGLTQEGRPGRSIELPLPPGGVSGLIDVALGPEGKIYVVDNYNNRVSIVGREAPRAFGGAGAKAGEFSAPAFCASDGSGKIYVADCLNGRVQVFSGTGEFLLSFGRAERGPGGFGRPKGIAVSAAGEIYVADSWLNTVQVFDAEGRFVAILTDENGRPLDLGSPNGIALGPGNRVYIAERLAARLQIRELIDLP